MTVPKDPARRLGFPGRPQQTHDLQADARFRYLTALSELAPACLDELFDTDVPGAVWAHRWGLDCPWGHRVADASRADFHALGARQLTLADEDDPGGWVAEAHAEDARGYREARHFDWLARYQVRGESFAAIAGSPDRRRTTELAIKRLAVSLALPLRRSPRGGARR